MAPIVVLSAPGGRGPSANPTVKMLVASLPEHVEVRTFSWHDAFLTRYDILHIHWPEWLLRDRVAYRQAAKRTLFALLLARTALVRTPTVWTVHNVTPHEPSPRIERILLGLWARRASSRVYMYQAAMPSSPDEQRDVLIRRGDYEPIYGALRTSDPSGPRSTRRLLLFGTLRAYKGIERLIDIVREPSDEPIELIVTGAPLDDAYARTLLLRAADAGNVTVRIGAIPDAELARVIQQSALVVLPYRTMYNSGAALLSLTLHRPILVPGSPTMRELRSEVGDDWVYLYDGELTGDDVVRALGAAATPHERSPDLTGREWGPVGQSYAALYQGLVGM